MHVDVSLPVSCLTDCRPAAGPSRRRQSSGRGSGEERTVHLQGGREHPGGPQRCLSSCLSFCPPDCCLSVFKLNQLPLCSLRLRQACQRQQDGGRGGPEEDPRHQRHHRGSQPEDAAGGSSARQRGRRRQRCKEQGGGGGEDRRRRAEGMSARPQSGRDRRRA